MSTSLLQRALNAGRCCRRSGSSKAGRASNRHLQQGQPRKSPRLFTAPEFPNLEALHLIMPLQETPSKRQKEELVSPPLDVLRVEDELFISPSREPNHVSRLSQLPLMMQAPVSASRRITS